MKKIVLICIIFAALLTGCMKWEYGNADGDFDAVGSGLFICNEGNFQYGNGSLSYYDPETRKVENDIFYRANGYRPGDVIQSMTMHNGLGWVVSNNSHVVFAIDPVTFREVGRIENLPSPRYIYFVSDTKAYISQIWDNRIVVINPRTYAVTGYITVPDMAAGSGSTEQMVGMGRYVYCNCWSYQNRLIKIDTETDRVVASLRVGIQPTSVVLDRMGRLWTLTDGGYEGSITGSEQPALVRVDPESFTVERRYELTGGGRPGELQVNGSRDTLYWIDNDVWRMDIGATHVPVRPFLEQRGTIYYGLTVDPVRGDVYVADAIDYQQAGRIYRYTAGCKLVDQFNVGITPGAFCWK